MWIKTLERKNYLLNINGDLVITQDGINMLDEKIIPTPSTPAITSVVTVHKKLGDTLYSLIQKRQVVGFGNVYFIPSVKDLDIFLSRFRKQYPDLWDLDKIQKCLIKHITNCAKLNKFAPAVKYFIIKEGSGSQLAAMLENMEDTVEETVKQHKITQTKDLFE